MMHYFEQIKGFAESLIDSAHQNRSKTGENAISLPRQVLEMCLLRAGPGKLPPEEYYMYRLYDRTLTLREKRSFISNRAMGNLRYDRRWGVVADDKLLCYALLSDYRIKIPENVAVIHAFRGINGARSLRSADECEAFFRDIDNYPFFTKPITGRFSRDVYLAETFDREADMIRLGDGKTITPHELARSCRQPKTGFIVQKLLTSHPDIAARFGDRLSTVRMIILRETDGPRVFAALWKIASARNMADNYWRSGNVLAVLDTQNGVVKSCTQGMGPELRQVEHHPDTGQRLIDFALPRWNDLREMAMKASYAVGGLPIQAWDMAITPDGPLALEVNEIGSLFLPQIAFQAGLNQGEFKRVVEALRA